MSDSPATRRAIGRPSWPLFLIVPVLLVLPFVLPIPVALERIYLLRSIGALCHFVLPALLVVFLHGAWGARGRLWRAAAIAFLLAAGAELLQAFTGRHPRLFDVGVDLGGIAFGMALRLRATGASWRAWLPLLAGLVMLPWAYWHVPGVMLARARATERFPLLADFESPRDDVLWLRVQEEGSRMFGVEREDGAGRAMCLEFGPDHLWMGLLMKGMPRDWSGHDRLVFSARIVQGGMKVMGVRLDDFRCRRDALWVHGNVLPSSEWRTFSLDLRSLEPSHTGREFRLDDIYQMVLYLGEVSSTTVIAVDDFRLE